MSPESTCFANSLAYNKRYGQSCDFVLLLRVKILGCVKKHGLPIVGLFLGVLALGPTIIGYFYAPVSSAERALFAVSSVLLMAPQMLLDPVFTLFPGVGAAASVLTFDLALRLAGGLLFGALAFKSRESGKRGEQPTSVGTASESAAE